MYRAFHALVVEFGIVHNMHYSYDVTAQLLTRTEETPPSLSNAQVEQCKTYVRISSRAWRIRLSHYKASRSAWEPESRIQRSGGPRNDGLGPVELQRRYYQTLNP